jgi:Asp-tRNA(Asn)/Glu-tRNA(Gln) amidotransferase A subunit family amidase
VNDLVLRSVSRQLEMLRSGEISALELAEAHVRQIERLNPVLNALVDFDAERVLRRARLLDANPDKTGALHGLPVTVKSSIATAGYRCEIGSTIQRGNIPSEDAPVVARLRAAGAVILGTTNCPEFLMAYETDNLLHGRTNNPWDLSRTPGGSSGGESAAIAACMSAAGLGSDSGGSVRLPAHFTGICALKPTPGRIPGRGHLPPCVGPFSVLGAIGPMARTVEDLTLLFDTLSGVDPFDPIAAPVPLRKPRLEELRSQTIGYFEDDGLVPVTHETRQAIQYAVKALTDAGFRVEQFRPRSLELLRKLWWTLFVRCGAMFYQSTIRGKEDQLSPIFREFLAIAGKGGPLYGPELLNAWAELDLLRGKMLEEMASYPILLCPVASIPAFRHGERVWQIEGREVAYLDAVRHTQWFNVLAAPAVVVPVSKSPEGLPIGVQIVARPYKDEVALAIAGILDKAFGYKPPPLALGLS